jgi:hypothetical protein
MIRLFLTAALTALACVCGAQSIEGFKARLAYGDSLSSAQVQVVEHGTAAMAVSRLSSMSRQREISGYRIRIFFDNSQNARTMATATRRRFEEMFPEIPSYMSYENPYFKVVVGNCATNEEAIILKARIEGAFDRAFISREDIPIQLLAQ